MKQKQMRLGTTLLALLTVISALTGCANQADGIKAAHAHEDASAQQARTDKRTK